MCVYIYVYLNNWPLSVWFLAALIKSILSHQLFHISEQGHIVLLALHHSQLGLLQLQGYFIFRRKLTGPNPRIMK